MKRIVLLTAFATLVTTIHVDAQSKGSQLSSGSRSFSGSSNGGKTTTNRPSVVTSTSSKANHSSAPKMRVGSSSKPTGPNHGFRKDDDFTRNGNNNSGASTPYVPQVTITPGRRFDVGPSFQLFTDYSYMARYGNNQFFRNVVCPNCVFPVVAYSGISSYNSLVGDKVMALKNITSDTLVVDVSFLGFSSNRVSSYHGTNTAPRNKTVRLAPGQTYYFLQHYEQYSIDVYINEKSEENLVNHYAGNCSPANIYLSLTADRPK